MRRKEKTFLLLFLVIQVVCCGRDQVSDGYVGYQNKRLTQNVIKTVKTLSTFHCTAWCSMTDGFLAVNVIRNRDITCELTTGLSNENEMEDDHSSELLVLDYNKCADDLGFCPVNAICERAWTSARCHCNENYYGPTCDVTFTTYADAWCISIFDISGNNDKCKELCAGRGDCSGMAIVDGNCIFLRESCRDNLISFSGLTVYMKTVN